MDLNEAQTILAEREIRALASTMLSRVSNRRDHPSYGVSKAAIREAYSMMTGAIALYGMLTSQIGSPLVWHMVTFKLPGTATRVDAATTAFKAL
jgi:hypothetical protein